MNEAIFSGRCSVILSKVPSRDNFASDHMYNCSILGYMNVRWLYGFNVLSEQFSSHYNLFQLIGPTIAIQMPLQLPLHRMCSFCFTSFACTHKHTLTQYARCMCVCVCGIRKTIKTNGICLCDLMPNKMVPQIHPWNTYGNYYTTVIMSNMLHIGMVKYSLIHCETE